MKTVAVVDRVSVMVRVCPDGQVPRKSSRLPISKHAVIARLRYGISTRLMGALPINCSSSHKDAAFRIIPVGCVFIVGLEVAVDITSVFSLALALMSVITAALLILVSRKKLTKSRSHVEKAIRAGRIQIARDVIGLHSDPHWREEQLRMLNKIE